MARRRKLYVLSVWHARYRWTHQPLDPARTLERRLSGFDRMSMGSTVMYPACIMRGNKYFIYLLMLTGDLFVVFTCFTRKLLRYVDSGSDWHGYLIAIISLVCSRLSSHYFFTLRIYSALVPLGYVFRNNTSVKYDGVVLKEERFTCRLGYRLKMTCLPMKERTNNRVG